MNTPSTPRYKNHRCPAEIIGHGGWLSLRFSLSYRDVEELLRERGIMVTGKPPHRSISVAPKAGRHLSAA